MKRKEEFEGKNI